MDIFFKALKQRALGNYTAQETVILMEKVCCHGNKTRLVGPPSGEVEDKASGSPHDRHRVYSVNTSLAHSFVHFLSCRRNVTCFGEGCGCHPHPGPSSVSSRLLNITQGLLDHVGPHHPRWAMKALFPSPMSTTSDLPRPNDVTSHPWTQDDAVPLPWIPALLRGLWKLLHCVGEHSSFRASAHHDESSSSVAARTPFFLL